MPFKKIIPLLCLLHVTVVHAGSKVTPSTPAQTQQSPPAAPTAPEAPPLSPVVPPPAKPEAAPQQETQAPVPLPTSHEMTNSYESAFVRMLVTLLGLVFLVFVTFWLLRRMGKGKFKMGGGRTINILERRALSPKSMLYIVEIGNKKVLISESQVEVRSLATYEELPEASE